MLEEEMTKVGFEYLSAQNKYKIVKQEVPFLSRCIDIVLLTQEMQVITIEFKVNKWRHAIEQAQNHKLGADKSYICLPQRNITEALSTAIDNAGIGLLLYAPDKPEKIYEVISPPIESQNIPEFRKMLLLNFNKV